VKGFVEDFLHHRFLRKNQVGDSVLRLALGGRERLGVDVERDPANRMTKQSMDYFYVFTAKSFGWV